MWKPARAIQPAAQHIVVWEFWIRPGREAEFVAQYGPDGAWTKLFSKSDGYIRTELLRDMKEERRFVTLDFWSSEAEFSRFHTQHLAEYERLDKELESLTQGERRLGAFPLGARG